MISQVKVPLEKIHLDKENPRLSEFGVTSKSSEKEIANILWKEMDVKELVLSIIANGFWDFEPLILLKTNNNEYTVIEGNRRLSAVKVIHSKYDVKLPSSISDLITTSLIEDTSDLPGIIVNDREEAWKYIGFKHVNGPQKWGSFAKAKYIAEIKKNYDIPINEIAYQIGDTHKIAQKLFQGYMVLAQAKQMGVYNFEEDIQANRLYFSHLYTGLQREGIKKYIDIENFEIESEKPVPIANKKQLGQLLEWLFGSTKNDTYSVIKSQNPDLKYLDEILQNKEATAALSSGETLENSWELSRPSDAVFEESILAAKRSLQKARAQLSTGYDGEENLLRIAGSTAKLADDLYEEMHRVNLEKLRKPKKKKRLTE